MVRFWWSRPPGYNAETFVVDEKAPIFFQVGHLGKRYEEWTHAPKTGAPIYFANPLMEMTTNTPWYMVPLVWVPVALGMICTAVLKYDLSVVDAIARTCYGVAFWTFLEYCIHRFLFHADVESYWTITFHFAFHGVHHKWPMDGLRLVFPPTFAAPIIYCLYKSFDSFCSKQFSLPLVGGGVLGYVAYDVLHYSMHHGPLQGILKVLKTKHMDHHFKVYKESYGITNFFWDLVFGTLPANFNTIVWDPRSDADQINDCHEVKKSSKEPAPVRVSATSGSTATTTPTSATTRRRAGRE